MRASLWATAVIALCGPRRAFILPEYSPRNGWLLCRGCAGTRNASAARVLVGRVLDDSTCPPLIFGSGHRRSHEQKAPTVGNRERFVPTSVSSTWAVSALMPGICVRSTPKARYTSTRKSYGSVRRGVL